MAKSTADADEVTEAVEIDAATEAVDTGDDAAAKDETTVVIPKPRKPRTPRPAPAAESASAEAKGIVFTPLMLALAALVVVLAVAATAFGFLWQNAASERDDARAQQSAAVQASDDNVRAQSLAQQYAIGAATIDYRDLAGWRALITKGTTDQLTKDLNDASNQFEQVVVPLQWQSTATPLGTIVTSNKDGLITVDVFLKLITKSTQRPEGIPSTATFTIDVDTKQDWKISDVRGMDAALQGK